MDSAAGIFLPTLFAIGPFVAGGMLLWGLVAGVPIVLHLLNRRRLRTVDWPAMQFLLAAMQKRSRSVRLWQWLLLLIRIMAVLMIAVALANPIFQQSLATKNRPAVLRVIVLDTSYSMLTQLPDGKTRFQVAKERATEVCRETLPGDTLMLFAMQESPLAIVPKPSADVDRVVRELERMQPAMTPASLPAMLAVLERSVPDDQANTLQAYFFSDAQQQTWQPATSGNIGARWQDLQSDIGSIEVIDVTDGQPQTTVNVRLRSLDAVAANRLTVTATADEPLSAAIPVSISVDGNDTYATSLAMNTQGDSFAEVAIPAAVGPSVVHAQLVEDSLFVDNERWLVRQPTKPLLVYCVGPVNRTRFVAAALQAGTEEQWEIQQLTSERFQALATDGKPRSADLLMMCDLVVVDAAMQTAIDRMVTARSGIIWWLGVNASLEGYTASELPFRLQEPSSEAVYPIDPRGYRHPIAAPFAPFPQSGLLSTPVFRYWKIEAQQGEVALGIGKQSDPLVIAIDRDQRVPGDLDETIDKKVSRTLVVTTAPMVAASNDDPAPWNLLVAWPSLVPLVQELSAWTTVPARRSTELQVGQSLTHAIAGRRDRPQTVTLLEPGISGTQQAVNRVLDVTPLSQTGQSGWTAGKLESPGIYRVEYADQTEQLIAVNVDPREGDLRKLTQSERDSLQRLGSEQEESTEDSTSKAARDEKDAQGESIDGAGDWFRSLLFVALGLLVTESLLSRFAMKGAP